MNFNTRLNYFIDSALHFFNNDISCPFDGSNNTKLVKRKHLVTSLYTCQDCGLRFRVPKETSSENESFYQEEYAQGFTTDVPDDATLSNLISEGFANSEKDYSHYIAVLKAANVTPGQTILDFGSSWGYGSWQLAQAGYRVYSYEISRPRARYAAEKLDCTMLNDVINLPEKVDCFFSSHVLEHLPDPNLFWQNVQNAVKPNGTIIAFTPNGDPTYERANPDSYHKMWGKVHPLMLTSRAYKVMARAYNCEGNTYSNPYPYEKITNGMDGELNGVELLFVGQKIT